MKTLFFLEERGSFSIFVASGRVDSQVELGAESHAQSANGRQNNALKAGWSEEVLRHPVKLKRHFLQQLLIATSNPMTTMDTEKEGQAVAVENRSKRLRKLRNGTIVWRFLVFASCLSAFLVMITNKEHRSVPIPLSSKYHYSKAFIWFVVAHGVGFGYALLTMLLTPVLRSQKFVRILLMLDLLVAFMLMSANGAATAIAYVGKNGLRQARWGSICGLFNRYCDHVAGALVAGYHGWLFMFLLIVFELHMLF